MSRQWRHECNCAPSVAEERDVNPWIRMHSQLSRNNYEEFDQNRLENVASDRIHEWLNEYTDGTVIVCNVCQTVKVVDREDRDSFVLYDPKE